MGEVRKVERVERGGTVENSEIDVGCDIEYFRFLVCVGEIFMGCFW